MHALDLRGSKVPPGLLNYVAAGAHTSSSGSGPRSSLMRSSKNYLAARLRRSRGLLVGHGEGAGHGCLGASSVAFGPSGEVVACFADRVEVYVWSVDGFCSLPNCHRVVKTFPVGSFAATQCYQVLAIVETKEERTLELRFLDSSAYRPENAPVVVDIPISHTDFSLSGKNPTRISVLADNVNGLLYVFVGSFTKPARTLRAKLANGRCVFDLCQDLLVYAEGDSSWKGHRVTPLQVSQHGKLVDKIVRNLSSTAIDSFCLFAEVSQFKLKKMFASGEAKRVMLQAPNTEHKPLPPADSYRDVVVKLFNTIQPNSCYLACLDLKKMEPVFRFVVPDGCSKVSFSPFDMQLLTASRRGDDISLWDYSCYGSTMVLTDKFERGKTFSVIEQICWTPNNRGFALLSRLNGSVHYFVTENAPRAEDTAAEHNWCLSGLGASQIAIGPANHSVLLAIKGSAIVAVDILNPTNAWFFELTDSVSSADNTQSCLDACFARGSKSRKASTSEHDPLEQIEVETCKPFPALYNDKRVHFAQLHTDFGSATADKLFHFGNCLSADWKDLNVAGGLRTDEVHFNEKDDSIQLPGQPDLIENGS